MIDNVIIEDVIAMPTLVPTLTLYPTELPVEPVVIEFPTPTVFPTETPTETIIPVEAPIEIPASVEVPIEIAPVLTQEPSSRFMGRMAL